VKFWDSSALVPLLVEEEATVPIRDLFLSEARMIAWWGTPVECASAVSRLERENHLSPQATTEALERLDALARHWHRIEPVEAVLETARRLYAPPTPSNSLPPSWRPKEGPRRWSSSAWTTGS
jgi:predicted nucleic acid-binding protein